MFNRHLSTLLRCLSLKESWVIFFILGIIMMNFPFLSIFNKSTTFFDIPLLYLYLYAGWFVSITVIILFSRTAKTPPPPNGANTATGRAPRN
jgi:hypothetical protein